jgi:hypothetical protein
MNIADAQRDVRTVFLGGFAGQLVSSILWLLSAALATFYTTNSAMLILVLGGIFIFPLTQLTLRLMGRRASLGRDHPMNQLAMQVAFTLPLNLLIVLAVTMYRQNWFYPAFMIALGAHYLPFVFLYGMRQFAILAVVLIAAGVVIGMCFSVSFSLGGWITGVVLLIFAFAGRSTVLRECRKSRAVEQPATSQAGSDANEK